MTKQVLVLFFIGQYVNEVLCDVAQIHTSHILLERPWQFNRKTTHDEVRNRYTIIKDSKTITFVPLTPNELYNDKKNIKRGTRRQR